MSGTAGIAQVAVNNSEAQAKGPVRARLTRDGIAEECKVNRTMEASQRTYESLFHIIGDYPSTKRAADGGPLPVFNPLIRLAEQTGSVASTITQGPSTGFGMTEAMRYAGLKAVAGKSTCGHLSGKEVALGAPVTSAYVDAAVEASQLDTS